MMFMNKDHWVAYFGVGVLWRHPDVSRYSACTDNTDSHQLVSPTLITRGGRAI